jgi:hypothetical protein
MKKRDRGQVQAKIDAYRRKYNATKLRARSVEEYIFHASRFRLSSAFLF